MNKRTVFTLFFLLVASDLFSMEEKSSKKDKKVKTWPPKKKSRVVTVEQYAQTFDPLDLKNLLDELPEVPPQHKTKKSRFKIRPTQTYDDSFWIRGQDWDPEDESEAAGIIASNLSLEQKRALCMELAMSQFIKR